MATPQLTRVEVGDPLPPFTRRADLEYWNRYAAVNDEFVPIHMDDEAGRAAGYPTAFGMGNLAWTYLHNAVREWLGEAGRIRSMSCQFRAPTTRGMTVTVVGTVTAVQQDGPNPIVDVDVWLEDEDGNRLTPGHAQVVLGP